MSRAQALVEASRLKETMERYGVKCSIELQEGRPNATGWGDNWYTKKVAHLNHHTAGSTTGLTPSLALCKRGRGTAGKAGYLPGPLCNGYGGRDYIYRILCMGMANHPGEGGPWKVPKIGGGYYLIPKDSARHLAWGTEWEHDGVSVWPINMRIFMARANAALMDYLGIPLGATGEHKDPWAPGRKSDRNWFTRSQWQADVAKYGESGLVIANKPTIPVTPTPAVPELSMLEETMLFKVGDAIFTPGGDTMTSKAGRPNCRKLYRLQGGAAAAVDGGFHDYIDNGKLVVVPISNDRLHAIGYAIQGIDF